MVKGVENDKETGRLRGAFNMDVIEIRQWTKDYGESVAF